MVMMKSVGEINRTMSRGMPGGKMQRAKSRDCFEWSGVRPLRRNLSGKEAAFLEKGRADAKPGVRSQERARSA